MNEEAIRYSYDLFVKDGYKDSFDDYKSLISSDPEALQYSYDLFLKDGYKDNIDDYKELLGVSVKKKEQTTTDLSSEGSSLGSLSQDNSSKVFDVTREVPTAEPKAIGKPVGGFKTVFDNLNEQPSVNPLEQPAETKPEQKPIGEPVGGVKTVFDVLAEKPAEKPVFEEPEPLPNGLIEKGNIDVSKQPSVKNPETGGESTVWSMSIGEDGKEILLSRVTPDGKIMSENEAIDYYHKTGKHLGIFKTIEDANNYSEQLHKDYESGDIKTMPAPPSLYKEVVNPSDKASVAPIVDKTIVEAQAKRYEEQTKKTIDKSIEDVITPELINSEETKAKATLDYHFKDAGFNFEETGVGNALTVTAPNGKKIDVDLNPLWGEKEEQDKLKDFIKNNNKLTSWVPAVERQYNENAQKFITQKEADDALKLYNEQSNMLASEQKTYLQDKFALDGELKELQSTPEALRNTKQYIDKYNAYTQKKKDLDGLALNLDNKKKSITESNEQLARSLGRYTEMQEEKGSLKGFFYDSFLGGLGELAAFEENLKVNALGAIIPTNLLASKSEFKNYAIQYAKEKNIKGPEQGQSYESWWKELPGETKINIDSYVTDKWKKYVKKYGIPNAIRPIEDTRKALTDVIGSSNTPEATKAFQEGAVTGLLGGLVKMAPAIFAPGGAVPRTALFFGQIVDNANKEMDDNPAFKDVSETEKLKVSIPIGITSTVLFELGLKGIVSTKPVMNSLVNSVVKGSFEKFGKDATAAEVKSVAQSQIKTMIANGAFNSAAMAVAGGGLKVAEIGIKDTYNFIKQKDMFDTPEVLSEEYNKEILQSGVQMALGAWVMHLPKTIGDIYSVGTFKSADDIIFKAFEKASKDPKIKEAFVIDLKNKINSGEMTPTEAKKSLDAYNQSLGIYRSIPDGLDIEQKKQAMDLLRERKQLEDEIAGKDRETVKDKQEQIDNINKQLNNLPKNAIQKPTTEEAVLQPEGPKVELPSMGQGDTQEQATPKEGEPSSKEEVVKFAEQITKPEEVKFETAFDMQDRTAEETSGKNKNLWGNAQVWRERIENAGDILRELSSRGSNPDSGYLLEKVKKLRDWIDQNKKYPADKIPNEIKTIEDFNNSKLKYTNTVDGYEYLTKFHSDALDKIKKEYESIHTYTKEQRLAIDLTLDLINNNIDGLESKLGDIENIAGKIKSEGKLEIVPDVKLGKQEPTPEGKTEPTAEAKVGEYEAKARKIADDINNMELPDWLKANLPPGTKSMGLDATAIKKIISEAVVKMGQLMDKGVEYKDALSESVKEIVKLFNETKDEKIKKLEAKVSQMITERFNKGDKDSAQNLPAYKKIMDAVDGVIKKAEAKGIDSKIIEQKVIEMVTKSPMYTEANDVQREQIVRDAREKLGLKEKSAPSTGKILGELKDVKKITMKEKDLLKEKIKALVRGAKDAKIAIAKASEALSKEIKEMTSTGKLSDTQAKNVLRKFSKTNVLSPTQVVKFVDYMTKVFADAEYSEDVDKAYQIRKGIKKLSKNANKDANIRKAASNFADIDPSKVEDIKEYNDIASKLKTAITGSVKNGQLVKFADAVNLEMLNEYTNKIMDAQYKQKHADKVAEIQELMGVDASELSYDEMIKLIDKKSPISKENSKIIRDTTKKMFDIYSATVKHIIGSGKDPFTDEEVEFTTKQKEIVSKFMDMNLSLMKDKDALMAVDAMSNFLENKSTAKMLETLSEYEGKYQAKLMSESGVKARPLRMYRNEPIGQFFSEQFASLPLLVESMFKGVGAGHEFNKMSGLIDLMTGKSKAQKESSNITNEYFDGFYKRKANKESFNTAKNITERGMTAFMSRNIAESGVKAVEEFNRRKVLIEESIDALSKGTKKERTKSKLYQDVYDKILKDSKDSLEVRSKTDKVNLEAIDWWTKKWADKYDDLSDISLNVYNKILDKDINYTPDKYSNLKSVGKDVDLKNSESAFYGHSNTDALYKKESGVLMKKTSPEELPKNDNGKADMYIDLSFDSNNANSMYDALIDMNTAAPIRQVESFLNSPYIDDIIPTSEDRDILKRRVDLYVKNARNKNILANDGLRKLASAINKITSVGVSMALGGPTQIPKQTIPVAINTLINAGRLDLSMLSNKDIQKFINESGYAIANRGVESLSNIESINKLVDLAANSKGLTSLKYIEKANEAWLKTFLVKPDVFIAKASWITYYEKALKKQGIDPSEVDYANHKLNKDAADYAQTMVDRQQNISDADLQGAMFSGKESWKSIARTIFMPFANFRMNQYTRMRSDVGTLMPGSGASVEDRKTAALSLSGFAAEMAVFKIISTGISTTLSNATMAMMGIKETKEDKEKRLNNLYKAQATGTLTDIFSPLPIFDRQIASGSAFALDKMQDLFDVPDDKKLALYAAQDMKLSQYLGTLGVPLERLNNVYQLATMVSTGKYEDKYGKTKVLNSKDIETLKLMIPVSLASSVGILPTEVNTIVRNTIKYAQKDAKTEKSIETEKNKKDNKNIPTDAELKKIDPQYYKEMKRMEKEQRDYEKQMERDMKKMGDRSSR